MSRHDTDDDGNGPDTPALWVREQGASGDVSFVGNDLTGVTGALPVELARFWDGNLPTGYSFTGNIGVLMDERIASRPMLESGFSYQQVSRVNAQPNTTDTIQLYHDPVAAWSGVSHKIRITSRNQTNGSMNSVEFNYLIQREGGAPTITQSAAYGTIGSAGYIAFGSGTIRLSWTGIAADASTYQLSIANTSGSAIHLVTAQVF